MKGCRSEQCVCLQGSAKEAVDDVVDIVMEN